MATYLVTGCAGFIGARVTALLLKEGHLVVGLDNLCDAYDRRLKHWRLAQLQESPSFRLHVLDIADRAALMESIGSPSSALAPRFDAVLHLAARAGVRFSLKNPWIYLDTNITGTLNLLELCCRNGIEKFVLASSSSVYGHGAQLPFREDARTDSPLSPYAASKVAAEALCSSYHHLYDVDVSVLRYFTVYGPAGRPDMMPFRMVQRICEGWPVTVFGDGSQSRDFTYVDDIAEGTKAALRPVGYEVINLGSDKPIALLQAIREVESCLDRQANLVFQSRHPADVTATWADIAKAANLLKWTPRTDFSDGISRLVDWYQANRSWAKEISTE